MGGRTVDFERTLASIEELVGPLRGQQADRLLRYRDAIVEASKRVNLVSRQSLDSIGEHLVDSAALLRFVEPSGGTLADLGSGAGLPGVVVAVLRPDVEVTLVDSRRPRVVFLKDVARRLGLSNLTVTHARIEMLADGPGFPLAVARALGSVDDVLAACLRLVSDGGSLVLFKGPRWGDEADAAERIASAEGAELVRTESVELPGLSRATTFVEFHVKHRRSR
jgi:16S rRNA (guanine527-N7)-methyltransferase